MTLKQRIARAKTARLCLNCQSAYVSHLGTSILNDPTQHREVETEVEHRFRCRSCFFRWSEFV
ncbi:MAG: hypothetical protein ACAI44_23560 [Candidatus Sericytochromatia bacterium]